MGVVDHQGLLSFCHINPFGAQRLRGTGVVILKLLPISQPAPKQEQTKITIHLKPLNMCFRDVG